MNLMLDRSLAANHYVCLDMIIPFLGLTSSPSVYKGIKAFLVKF